jgi:hypothetical protein
MQYKKYTSTCRCKAIDYKNCNRKKIPVDTQCLAMGRDEGVFRIQLDTVILDGKRHCV